MDVVGIYMYTHVCMCVYANIYVYVVLIYMCRFCMKKNYRIPPPVEAGGSVRELTFF